MSERPDPARGTLRGRPRIVVRAGLIGMAKPLVRLRIGGLENVPAEGPVLVAANHLHNADPVLLAMAFPRVLYFMAKRELFGNAALGGIIRWAGAFPVDRGKADRAAIRHAEALLADGHAVAMFPEGTRSRTGRLGSGQPGAGLILLRSGVPLVPAAITGTDRLPGGPGVTIRFGEPRMILPADASRRMTSVETTERIMTAIAELLPDSYRP